MPYKKQLEELSTLSRLFDAGLLQVNDTKILPLSFFSYSYDVLKKMNSLIQEIEEYQMEQMKHLPEMPQQSIAEIDVLRDTLKALQEDMAEEEFPIQWGIIEDQNISQKEEVQEIEDEEFSEPVIEERLEEIQGGEELPKEISPDYAQTQSPKVHNLRKYMSLNDRFRFQRELFSDSREKMEKELDYLESLPNIESVLSYLTDSYGWNLEEGVPADFKMLLERTYV